ncbi:TonB-dependent siderophore receptor [Fulvimarina endophytica]|uniref:TonB-dependent siderophore receptor n=1 Tax=Fulvimarina endophytica TaxID=2293836 RepID=A0A371X2Q2_9HYPH|nr:TonB-dependent siderophore receptor [Fulvimarina endophytica]RFC63507.1 TonB-dependent siderophore receptor [Fulvimarina endophytica]
MLPSLPGDPSSTGIVRLRRHLHLTTAALAAFSAAFSAGAAFAQGTIQLDQVVVEADAQSAPASSGPVSPAGETSARGVANPGPVDGYVAENATAGSKLATPIKEIPQVVTVTGREELDDLGVLQVDEALRYSPGVFASPFGADSDTDWGFIRGFQTTQTGFFLDGLPLFQYAFASIIIDPFILDRVEVLNGPGSALYGAASAGGIVNLSSKRADGERIRYMETGITDEPKGYVGFDLGDRFSLASPWSYRLTGRVLGGDDDVDYADQFRGVIMPQLHYEGEDTRADLYAIYQRDDSKHTNGFLPYAGTVVDAPYGRVPNDLFVSEPGPDDLKANQTLLGYEIEHDVNDVLTLRSNGRYANIQREEYQIYPFDLDQTDRVLSRGAFGHDTEADLVTLDNQAILTFGTGVFDHRLLVGAEYRYYGVDQVQASNFATIPDLDPINPVYGKPLPALFAPYLDETVDLNSLGLYAQDQIRFGRAILTLNGRYDSLWTDRDDRTSFGNDYDNHEDAFSGRAALGYEIADGLVPYISASSFFEPQIGTNTLGNPVGAQDGEQYEAGVKWAPTGLDAVFTAAVFDLTRRNTLQSRFVGGAFINEARGQVNSQGIELDARVGLADGLDLVANFTTYDIEIEKDANPLFVGNRPFVVPETFASAFLNYRVESGMLEGVELGGGVRYVGKSYADNLNEFEVPDVTLVDARIAYEKEDWGVSLNVNNLFDEDYVSSCQETTACYYGEGRRGLLKAHFNF